MNVLIVNIIFLILIQISFSIKIKLRQFTEDDQFVQAQVPPLISVLMNVPAYGRKELYDWDSFIDGNKKLMKDIDKKKKDTEFKIYSNKLSQIGKVRANLGRD